MWYYLRENQQQGPVSDADLNQLVQQGVVTEATMVWREGMDQWQSLGQATGVVAPVAEAPAATPASLGGTQCSGCGRSFSLNQLVRIGGQSVCSECQPAATQAANSQQRFAEASLPNSSAAQMRRANLKHERAVRSIGILYYFSAALWLLFGTTAFRNPSTGGKMGGLFMVLLAAGFIGLGRGLSRLKPQARRPAIILACVGLIGFPIGTIINAYVLYLLCGQSGKTMFSPQYQQVVELTPDIQCRTSLIVRVLFWILIAVLGLGAVVVFFAPSTPPN